MLASLDHVVIAVRELEAAAGRYAALLGRKPSWRGVHPTFGTANALFQLANAYLELLAPAGEGPVAERLERHLDEAGEGLFAVAFGTHDAAETALELRDRGLDAPDPAPGEGREAGTGAERRWQLVLLPETQTRGVPLLAVEHTSGGPLPEAAPTAAAGAIVTGIDHVVVMTPDPDACAALYGGKLGLRLALDRSFPERGSRLLFFRVGGVTVEVAGRLAEPPRPEEPDRLHGLAYQVPDADAARARVAEAGFDVSEVRSGAKPGTRVCTVRSDTHGVATLLIQPVRPGR